MAGLEGIGSQLIKLERKKKKKTDFGLYKVEREE